MFIEITAIISLDHFISDPFQRVCVEVYLLGKRKYWYFRYLGTVLMQLVILLKPFIFQLQCIFKSKNKYSEKLNVTLFFSLSLFRPIWVKKSLLNESKVWRQNTSIISRLSYTISWHEKMFFLWFYADQLGQRQCNMTEEKSITLISVNLNNLGFVSKCICSSILEYLSSWTWMHVVLLKIALNWT